MTTSTEAAIAYLRRPEGQHLVGETSYRTSNACSCGCKETHLLCRRTTADDRTLEFYSDGTVFGKLGIGCYGGACRSAYRTRAAIDANWLVADIAGMFDEAEIKMLVRVARKVCAGSGWGWISDGYRRAWIISETQRLLAGEPSRIVRR